MAQGASFIRVPPQSTGKRVATEARTQVVFDNLTGDFNVGDLVTGSLSGATGVITAIAVEDYGPTEGLLWLRDVDGTFQNNENLQVSAVTQAATNFDVEPLEEYDYQAVIITDPDNPNNQQRIDRFGATVNTFNDGSPVFGSFGTLTVGEPQVIGEHRFAYDGHDDHFWDQEVGGGTITYVPAAGVMLFSTGTASGDFASRTCNFYHPYSPGVGHLVEMTLRVGDTGKANVRRRWGYFDDDNGVFFELDGTDLYVVVRSNVSGSVVDTRIARDDWTRDRLDGSGNIGFNLDVSNANIYWIDLQWLGAGRVRFGVVEPQGSRVVAHVVEHANNNVPYPYMRTATLPIRVEQENTAAAASTSELRFACAAVKHSSKVEITGTKFAEDSGLQTITTLAGEVPLMSIRPKTTYNSITNRALLKAISSNFVNVANTGDGPIIFRVRFGTVAALTGASFDSYAANSTAEIDVTATAVNPALTQNIASFIVGPNDSLHIMNTDSRTVHSLELFLNADGVTQPVMIVTAECLSGTNAGAMVAVNWEEIKL
jgi:hypothetical protein